VISDPRLLLNDGMHPNAAGIRKMAARVVPLAKERLKKS
jgi:lysophospholipase L1-like esterase